MTNTVVTIALVVVVAGCDGAQLPLAQLGRAGGVGRDVAAAVQRLEDGRGRHTRGPIVKKRHDDDDSDDDDNDDR